MPQTKGSDVMVAMDMVEKAGEEKKMKFMSQLSEGTRKIAATLMSTSWISVKEGSEIFSAAADVLYPGDASALRRLGEAISNVQLNTVYKIFIRTASPESVAKKVCSIWKMYYDSGDSEIENFSVSGGVLVVRNFPELTPVQREVVAGYLKGLMQRTGVWDVKVQIKDQNPREWRWIISWEAK